MRPFRSLFLALASAALVVVAARAARPQFGGTLQVETDATIRSLIPGSTSSDELEAAARARIVPLVFETLVAANAGGLRPLVAVSWADEGGGARWRFQLRPGIKLHDGSALEPWQVATSLRSSGWKVATDGNALVIEPQQPIVDLPWVLADASHAIVVRTASGEPVGTGPFRLERQEATVLSLRAHDEHWGGRPFLDAVRIETGRPLAAQLTDLENGRAAMVNLRPLDVRRVTQRGLRVVASLPIELVALVFEPHRAGEPQLLWRRALAASFDRSAMCTVLLQRRAEPADALLPNWLAGYRLPFPPDRGRALSKAEVAALPPDLRQPTIRVDPADAVAQAIAERIAVDARASRSKCRRPAGSRRVQMRGSSGSGLPPPRRSVP